MAERSGDADFVERYIARSKLHIPRPKQQGQSADGGGSDAARMRKLFEVIQQQRTVAGWSWKDVVEMLMQSHIPRASGKPWTPDYVRVLYGRESERRAGRGTWRTKKAARRAGKSQSELEPLQRQAADQGNRISEGRAGETQQELGSAGKTNAEYDGPRSVHGFSTMDAETRPRDVVSRLTLRPVDRKPKGAKDTSTRQPGAELPALQKRKTEREWNLGDDMDYHGRANQNGQVIGAPDDWDGISRWSYRAGGWVHPDGTLRLAEKVVQEMESKTILGEQAIDAAGVLR